MRYEVDEPSVFESVLVDLWEDDTIAATLILQQPATLATESGHKKRWTIAKNYRKYFFFFFFFPPSKS